MSDNVIRLPRPASARGRHHRFGLYFRPGHSQHKDMLDALAGGKTDFTGIVVEANKVERRHNDLVSHAHRIGLDVILDPKTQAMAMPGGYSNSTAQLPWGMDRAQTIDDYKGENGRGVSRAIAEFAKFHGCTEILGPTHILVSANDPWLRLDIENMRHLRLALEEEGNSIQLIYPLTISMQLLRDSAQRDAIISALLDAPMDALWLKTDNFGSDASGEKTVAYIQAARAFHVLGKPVIADHVGGLSALGLLSFGAVGGIAQGLTMLEGFSASRLRSRPKEEKRSGSAQTRIYLPELDLMLKPAEAQAFITSSTRARSRFGCRDTHCCPGGLSDMLAHPLSHFMHRRCHEIQEIGRRPESLRVAEYIDKTVRPVSDHVAAAVGLGAISNDLKKKLQKKQKLMGGFRGAIAHLAEGDSVASQARVPPSRRERDKSK
jgi:hypothetical protein